MKPSYALFFNEINKTFIQKGKYIYMYFIPQQNSTTAKAKLNVINGIPFILIDESLKQMYKTIDVDKIKKTLQPKYIAPWRAANDKFQLSPMGTPVKMNVVLTAVFGPYFLPWKAAQSYNAYTKLFFRIDDLLDLVNGQRHLFRTFDKKYDSEGKEYVTLEDYSNAFDVFKSEKAESNNGDDAYSEQKTEKKEDFQEENLNKQDKEAYEEAKATYYTEEYVKLQKASIKNLMLIKEAEISFSNNINIFLGGNDTGKTSLLKYLYAHIKTLQQYNNFDRTKYITTFQDEFLRNIPFIYGTRIANLITVGQDILASEIEFSVFDDNAKIKIEIEKDAKTIVSYDKVLESVTTPEITKLNSVFIPAKEVLGMYKAINTTKSYKGGFDDTYIEVATIFERLDKHIDSEFATIVKEIEDNIIFGRIEFDSELNKYVFVKDGNKFDIDVTSEGVKQVGMISTLIKKGEIRSGTILFIDEPDINMNPVAIRKLVAIFKELTLAGVQLFISTHSYFILHWMALVAQYFKDEIDIRCFTIQTDAKENITSHNLKNGIPPQNRIIEEADLILDKYLGL